MLSQCGNSEIMYSWCHNEVAHPHSLSSCMVLWYIIIHATRPHRYQLPFTIKAQIMPILEYVCVVWDLHLIPIFVHLNGFPLMDSWLPASLVRELATRSLLRHLVNHTTGSWVIRSTCRGRKGDRQVLLSLPCFPAFCWSALPTSHYIFNVFYSPFF